MSGYWKQMGYDQALAALRAGRRMRRAGWNGKGMWVALVKGDPEREWGMNWLMRSKEEEQTIYKLGSFIVMKTADNTLVPWLCSQTDALAYDWELAE